MTHDQVVQYVTAPEPQLVSEDDFNLGADISLFRFFQLLNTIAARPRAVDDLVKGFADSTPHHSEKVRF